MRIKLFFIAFFIVRSILAQHSVDFAIRDFPIVENGIIGIRGSASPLSWDKSIALDKIDSLYKVEVNFDSDTKFLEFKFVLDDDSGNTIWEEIENRVLVLNEENILHETYVWNEEKVVDLYSLPKLTPEQLEEDYSLIEEMVLKVHPGTYRYNDSLTIQKGLAQLKASFQTEQTYSEVYKAISKLMAQIQCDHTFASFYNQNNLVKAVIHNQKDKLPFTFRWLNGEMVITHNASDQFRLKPGTQIVSINDIDVAEIKNKLMPYVSADGATDKSRIYKLEVKGYDFRYGAFDVFYPLVFPIEEEQVKLEFYNPNETALKTMRVSTTTLTNRNAILKERYLEFPKTRDDLWKFEITEDEIGILTLNSFGLNGWKALTLDYKSFLNDAFSEIKLKGVNNLIIDIRENNGGADEIAEELATYFNIERIIIDDREGRTRYKSFPERLKPFAQSWGDPWYYDLKPKPKEQVNGYYIFADGAKVNRKNERKENVYTGKIYLLTSPANASLAYYLAKSVKKDKIGTLIGDETGGNLRGINGGQILFLRLPGSGIEIDFPVMGDFTIVEKPNHGVFPDVISTLSKENIINKRDPGIETVRSLIGK